MSGITQCKPENMLVPVSSKNVPIRSANPWAFWGQVLRLEAARIHLASESLTLHPAACDGGGGPGPGLQGEGGPPRPSPYAAVCLHRPQAPSSAQGLVPGPVWKCCHGCTETLDFLIQAAAPWPRRTPPPSQGAPTCGWNHRGAILATLFSFRFLMGKYSVALIHFKNEKQGA